MAFFYFVAIIFFLILCTLLCVVILLQESKNVGLGASFGGEASDSLFGTSTADVLRRFTAWLAVAFLVACIILSVWTTAMGRSVIDIQEPGMEQVSPPPN